MKKRYRRHKGSTGGAVGSMRGQRIRRMENNRARLDCGQMVARVQFYEGVAQMAEALQAVAQQRVIEPQTELQRAQHPGPFGIGSPS